MLLSLVALCIISVCFLRRVQNIRSWSSLPVGGMLIIGIYLDSFLFVFITAVFKDVGLNESVSICRAAILLCLTLYLSTKVCVYLFLVEKAVSQQHSYLHVLAWFPADRVLVHCSRQQYPKTQR